MASGSGVMLQSGTLAVWNAERGQSRWELSAAVLEAVSRLRVTPSTHTRTHPPHSTLVSRHKSVGPSCVTKMKQAQRTLSEPSMRLLPLPAGETDTKSVHELPEVVKHALQCTGSGHPDYLCCV